MEAFFLKIWYQKKRHFITYLLMPFSWIYWFISQLRRFYLLKIKNQEKLDIPIIVIGNISLGGVGKTPLVCYLYQKLKEQGLTPGIVSRGYARQDLNDKIISEKDNAKTVGDEPWMLYQRLKAPMAVATKRLNAVKLLIKNFPKVDIILSDDGLQHYKMPRDIEIVVIDGKRGLGNGLIFPAGPLRESVSRLKDVDFVIVNGELKDNKLKNKINYKTMNLNPEILINLKTGEKRKVSQLVAKKIIAVSGIGNPKRFFQSLESLGYEVVEKAFPDHYTFREEDLKLDKFLPIIMTEKDAVKCRSFAKEYMWYLEINAHLDHQLLNEMNKIIKDIKHEE